MRLEDKKESFEIRYLFASHFPDIEYKIKDAMKLIRSNMSVGPGLFHSFLSEFLIVNVTSKVLFPYNKISILCQIELFYDE